MKNALSLKVILSAAGLILFAGFAWFFSGLSATANENTKSVIRVEQKVQDIDHRVERIEGKIDRLLQGK